MNDFTASNGISVANHGGNWDRTTIHFSGEVLGLTKERTNARDVVFEDRDFEAIREFFQAEADERLGRWRWPENPDYVVIVRPPGIRVVSEKTGQYLDAARDQYEANPGEPTLYGAARAYFDAHPEPKPWHDAAEGEVWILMFRNSSHAWFVNGEYFQSAKTLTNISKFDEGIVAGRRIFPEEVAS
ncbi:hypothetical protein [Microbacterium sp. Leaf203]|uniref:hypothetical protein n=1 Tax=Microbacterium sp. Leaf203 TaxID=1735677 RepID=UPI0006F8A7F1|nr:hypothetical protein [Microbacterium sp. Leaf203]KQM38414.1 hypothetical protein ASE56_14120 [Microbacterium sp. Leaf203]